MFAVRIIIENVSFITFVNSNYKKKNHQNIDMGCIITILKSHEFIQIQGLKPNESVIMDKRIKRLMYSIYYDYGKKCK